MEHEYQDRSGVLGFVAKVLNEAGGAIVDIYELGSMGVDKLGNKIKKSPDQKVRKLKTYSRKKPKIANKKTIKAKIKNKELKIEKLYSEIGKEGSKLSETGEKNPLEKDSVKMLISSVRDYEGEIKRLESQITEFKDKKKESNKKKNIKEIRETKKKKL